jgi:hypothetical protein
MTKHISASFLLLLLSVSLPHSALEGAPPAETEKEESINGRTVDSLLADMRDRANQRARIIAIDHVGRNATHPEIFFPEIKAALKDSDPVIRATAAQMCGVIGARQASLVSEFLADLASALDDSQDSVRFQAVAALGQIGAPAYELVPKLKKLSIDDPSQSVRDATLDSLVRITLGGKDQHSIAVFALEQKEFPVRGTWIESLNYSIESLNICRRILGNQQEPNLRVTAIVHLTQMRDLGKPAVDDLLQILDEPIEYQEVYASPDPGQSQQQPKLIGREPKSFHLRLTAAWAITEIDLAAGKQLFDKIELQLASDDADERLAAAIIISRLSDRQEAKRLAAKMDSLKDDTDIRVRTIARLGYLRLIQPDFRGQSNQMHSTLPLPEDDAELADNSKLRLQLSTDLKQLELLLRKQAEASQPWDFLCDFLTPNRAERALVQGDFFRQWKHNRGGYYKFANFLADVELKDLAINDRTVVLPVEKSRETLRFYYFDGHWKLMD